MFSHAWRAQQLMDSFGGASIVLSEYLKQLNRYLGIASEKCSSQGIQFVCGIRTPRRSMGE
jgi:hypothetical protein